MKINKDRIISTIVFILTISIGIIVIHFSIPAINESIRNLKSVDIVSTIFNSVLVSCILSIILILIVLIPGRHNYLHR